MRYIDLMLFLHRPLMITSQCFLRVGSLSLTFGWLSLFIFLDHHPILILEFVTSFMFYRFSQSCCFKSNFQHVGLISVQSSSSPWLPKEWTRHNALAHGSPSLSFGGADGRSDQWFDGKKREYKLECTFTNVYDM